MLSTEKEKEMWRWIMSLMNEWAGVSLGSGKSILGDPGAVSWVDKMCVVKVFYKIESGAEEKSRRLYQ